MPHSFILSNLETFGFYYEYRGTPVGVLVLISILQHSIAKEHLKGLEMQVIEYPDKFMILGNKAAIVISFHYYIYSLHLNWKNSSVLSIPGTLTGN